MSAIVSTTEKIERDALDIEFDAMHKQTQLAKGIQHNGLFLVGAAGAPVIQAPAKRSKLDRIKAILLRETA